ncbi:MAG: hypothetical protein A4E32_01823 [Methanomassiliicoccales archaeon PtaU1.Bin124]|nr:MAG: hypothetical protein A4E32_01823 [Methanomassiliicoccales archaeon PtaU1.Bin124]
MREESKVIIEMAAKRRSEQILKATPGVETNLVLDDSGLRGALQVIKDGELLRLEFIETESTAGQVHYFDDYIEVARSTGSLILIFPVSKYSRDMAAAVYQGILNEVKKKAERDVELHGYVFDTLGNVNKVC